MFARGHREEDGERGAEAHRCGLRRVSGGQGGSLLVEMMGSRFRVQKYFDFSLR